MPSPMSSTPIIDFLLFMGLSVSWKKGGLWSLKRFVRQVSEEFTPEIEMDELLLLPNVEVSQPNLALLLLLPDNTKLYDSLPEVTITSVDFNLATKSLQLKGFCESSDGKRFFLKTILQTKVFDDDMHMTTMLYEKEEQAMASFITSAVFLPSLEESLERLLAEEEDLEDMSDDSNDDFDFTSAAFLPSLEVTGDCKLDSGEGCLCSSCLNDLTFDDGEGDEEEQY